VPLVHKKGSIETLADISTTIKNHTQGSVSEVSQVCGLSVRKALHKRNPVSLVGVLNYKADRLQH